MKVINFGSLNIDYTYKVDHILIGGETLSAFDRNVYCGGKGLNQSLALARAGIAVWHAGSIGRQDGQVLSDVLSASGVNLEYLKIIDNIPSGHTIIQVDQSGQNCILVYGGANKMITREQIYQTLSNFSKNDYLVLQNEINEIPYIMELAYKKGIKIILNPSPIDEKIRSLPLEYVDFFLVNEIEAAPLAEGNTDLELLDNLQIKYPNSHIVMTVGSRGAYYANQDTREYHDIFDVDVVDTTAAGDTFTGFFMAAFLEEKTPLECLRFASAASALAVSRAGASASIPLRKQVINFLAKLSS
ncbi:MAG TPA: ribokinase [Dysgonamonadaceae bacterium]|nr:ribokinase [Dysgonamonadaceae bacterium]